MVLNNVNVANTSGNGSSSVVRKIHNMPWLKQASDPKNSGPGKTSDGTMYKALANLTEDGQVVPEKKSKRRGSRKSRSSKPKSDVSQSINITMKTGAQSGVGQGVWCADKNAVQALFPEATETASTEQSEEEQMTMALAASLETAFLEKCAVDPPVEPDVEPAKLSDEEDIWDGVHKNLPSPDGKEEAVVESFDANNNSGSNKSRLSSVATGKSDNKAASCESSRPAASEPRGDDEGKIEAPLTPAIEPKYIDKFGRVNGYTEKRLFMGKGARWKEEKYREQQRQQQQHESSGNGSSQRPGHSVGSQDSRSRNSRQPLNNLQIDNRSSGYSSNDRQSYSSNDSRRSRNNRPPGNNSRNDDNGPSVEAVTAHLKNHFTHTPHMPYRQNEYHAVADDSRNDRQQGRFSRPANQDATHNYREPTDQTKKDPYKYTRQSNDRSADDRNGKNSGKSDAEHVNRTDNDTSRDDGAKKIDPLMSITVERPSSFAAAVQESSKESSTPIDRPIVAPKTEPPTKIVPGVSQKETTTESSIEPSKPHVQLSDFNSRYSAQQERAMSTSEMNPSRAAQTTIYTGIADASCQTGGIQFPPAFFTVPPPGFACLDTARNPSNAMYVLPVDSSQTSSSYRAPMESSRTSSDYLHPAESSSDSFTEAKNINSVWDSLKMLDPMFVEFMVKNYPIYLARRSAEMQASVFPTTPEVRQDRPIDSVQDPRTAPSYELPAEQRRQTETLNPNAKQYSPISKQTWISHNQQDPMSCYAIPASYDLQVGVYCPYVPSAHDVHRQDNPGWPCSGGHQLYGAFHPAQHQLAHYANETVAHEPAPAPQGYMVSEQNLPFKNAQRPTNLPTSNDDYPLRCQTSGLDDVPTDSQRQAQYRDSHRQCGVAPGQFCSAPCGASYGGQSRPMDKCLNHPPPSFSLQQYLDVCLKRPGAMIGANPRNHCHYNENEEHIRGFAQQGCVAPESNSIKKTEHSFVQPIVQPMSFSEKANVPGKGRGRVRRSNNQ